MHTATITTTTPHGQLLSIETATTTGDRHEVLAQAADLARRVTIDLHAADPQQQHTHLIALSDEPHAVIAARTLATGRTDLLATLSATSHITD